jgi:hypothetical protein
MKTINLQLLASISASVALASAGCNHNSQPETTPNASASSGASSGASSERSTHVRLAHLVPGGPNVDFCYRTELGGPFKGPVLRSLSEGPRDGLPYSKISEYVPIDGTPNAIRLVTADTASCEQDLAGTSSVNILGSQATSNYLTVAATGVVNGTGDAAMQLRVLSDTHQVSPSGTSLHFMHAASGLPAVDVGTVNSGAFSPLFTNVSFGSSSSAGGGADQNGFLPIQSAPVTTTLVVRATQTNTDLLTLRNVNLPGNSILSIFAIGTANGTGPQSPAALLCNEQAASTDHFASCRRLTM